MHPSFRLAVAFGTALFATHAYAAEPAIEIDAGQWRMTTYSAQPMATQEQKSSKITCVEDNKMTPEKFIEDSPGCTVSNTTVSESVMKFDMACTERGSTMNGRAEYYSKGKSLTGKMVMSMEHGGMKMSFETRLEGEWVKAKCD